jgi:hypothetical protein
MTCWHCGAPWRCPVCHSFRKRNGRSDCHDCHVWRTRDQRADDRDIKITPAMRRYLRAFDAYLAASKTTGTPEAEETAKGWRSDALIEVLEEAQVSR